MKEPYQRSISIPQETLRRASEAVREVLRSGDCILIAKTAIETAFRREGDVRELLADRKPPAFRPKSSPAE